jgi:hypothetical protein
MLRGLIMLRSVFRTVFLRGARPGLRTRRADCRPRLECLESRDVPSTLLVDDDKKFFHNAGFTSI